MQYANHDDPVARNLVEDQIIAVHTAANTRFVMAGNEGNASGMEPRDSQLSLSSAMKLTARQQFSF
jgi:hypothetical protein